MIVCFICSGHRSLLRLNNPYASPLVDASGSLHDANNNHADQVSHNPFLSGTSRFQSTQHQQHLYAGHFPVPSPAISDIGSDAIHRGRFPVNSDLQHQQFLPFPSAANSRVAGESARATKSFVPSTGIIGSQSGHRNRQRDSERNFVPSPPVAPSNRQFSNYGSANVNDDDVIYVYEDSESSQDSRNRDPAQRAVSSGSRFSRPASGRRPGLVLNRGSTSKERRRESSLSIRGSTRKPISNENEHEQTPEVQPVDTTVERRRNAFFSQSRGRTRSRFSTTSSPPSKSADKSTYIPLTDEEDEENETRESGSSLFSGRRVQGSSSRGNYQSQNNILQQSSTTNSPIPLTTTPKISRRNNHFLRNRGKFSKLSTTAPSLPKEPISVEKSGQEKNRFTVEPRPPVPPKLDEKTLTSKSSAGSSAAPAFIGGDDDEYYTVEYIEYPDYHFPDEQYEEKLNTQVKPTPFEKTEKKVTVSVSSSRTTARTTTGTTTTTTSTTPKPAKKKKESVVEIPTRPIDVVVSVATTRSVSSSNSNNGDLPEELNSKGISLSPASKPSTQTIDAVQSSRDAKQAGKALLLNPTSTKLLDSMTSSAEMSPEYYEEEYSYPDNYPVLSTGDEKKVSQVVTKSVSSSTSVDTPGAVENERRVNLVSRKLPSKRDEIPLAHYDTFINQEEYLPVAKPVSTTTTTTEKPSTTTAQTRPVASLASLDILQDIQFAQVSADLLPPGFKSPSKPVPSTASTTTTTTTTTEKPTTEKSESRKPFSLFPAVKFAEVDSSLLPKGFKPNTSVVEIVSEDLDPSLLPKGFKPVTESMSTARTTTTTLKTTKNPLDAILKKVQFKEIASPDLIPADYTTSTVPSVPNNNPLVANIVSKINFAIPASLLPKGYKKPEETSDSTTVAPVSSTTVKAPGGLVFPTRPGISRHVRPGIPQAPKGEAPKLVPVTIAAGWPTRSPTVFTGWPTKPTEATTTSRTTTTERSTTTMTTTTRRTTTAPPIKSSPFGECSEGACKMEATLRIIGGVRWKPEYADINTDEFKLLKSTVKREVILVWELHGISHK